MIDKMRILHSQEARLREGEETNPPFREAVPSQGWVAPSRDESRQTGDEVIIE